MTPIVASRPNVYAASPLDRASGRREDAAWIAAALAEPRSLFVPVWRSKSLLRSHEDGRPEAIYLEGEAAAALGIGAAPGPLPWAFLGLLGERAVFGIDLSSHDDPLPLLPADIGGFIDLRATGGALANDDAAMLAHARGLLHWRARHGFCGVCGGPTVPRAAGNTLGCTQCGTQHFPRTDAAVIMLVIRDDRVLLGHSQRFPRATMYSTLAGFLEPGETLEEAVRREVREESGILVGRVHYHSSQPWPFPASIMLGFYAEGLSEAIVIDPGELRDARWFSRAELADPAAHGFHLPRADSIARRLIEDWMAA